MESPLRDLGISPDVMVAVDTLFFRSISASEITFITSLSNNMEMVYICLILKEVPNNSHLAHVGTGI